MHLRTDIPLILCFVFCFTFGYVDANIKLLRKDNGNFGFASSFHENMVLQMKPQRAVLWGYGTVGAIVNVSLLQDVHTTKVVEGPNQKGIWRIVLKPQTAGGPHTFQGVQDNHGLLNWILLKNVLFGDVWICGGQSNMQFTVAMGDNATEELRSASKYPNVRVMTPTLVDSDVPLYDFQSIEQQWSIPSADSIGGPTWSYFSAVCWFYGRDLYDHLKVPIGLISSNWGGTPIECWSSPKALKKCGLDTRNEGYDRISRTEEPGAPPPYYPTNNSVLWNAMIHPLLNMTIKGAIWYQGEQNSIYHTAEYSCSFPAMIQDWREAWYEGTQMLTNSEFPFGFVQLSTYNGTDDGTYSLIRWHQTADYGFVPNVKMPNTFMAVAMDLGDPESPFGSIHPRDKQDVSYRLALGGLNVAYGQKVHYQGPIPDTSVAESNEQVVVNYKTESGLKVSKKGNFEVCCDFSMCDYAKPFNTSGWNPVPIISHTRRSITLNTEACSAEDGKASVVRYAWQLSPCKFKKCSVYDDDGLPAPPFIILVS